MALYDNKNSQQVSIPKRYRDLPMSFTKHPGTGDVKPVVDIESVKQSVKNLILTNYGERPFKPNLGSNVTSFLFEPANPFTSQALKREIDTTLKEQEPRVNGITTRVFDDADRNAYIIELSYNIVSLNTRVETSFFLRRLR